MESKKGIKFIEGILREVAKEENLTDKEIEEIWRIHKLYVRELMDKEDTHIISIPYLGNLYYNIFTERGLRSKHKKEESLRSSEIRKEILLSQEKGLKTSYKYPQNMRGALMSTYYSINKNYLNKKKKLTTFLKAIKLIEDFGLGKIIKEEKE